MRVAKPLLQNDVVAGGPLSPRPPVQKGTGRDEKSSDASLPGDEFPPAMYRTVIAAFAWMMLAAWLAFGGTKGTDLDLAVATVLCTVFFAIPILLRRTAYKRVQRPQVATRSSDTRIDIATGPVSRTEAWLQVILIPVALAVAATLIGGVFAITS